MTEIFHAVMGKGNLSLLPLSTGATISTCGLYRYLLWRIWDASKPYCLFLLLNPSTADGVVNDATVERCQRRAAALGYGGVYLVNLFAFRSTDPSVLTTVLDPIGPKNDQTIIAAAKAAGIVICGWGSDQAVGERGRAVLALLRSEGILPHALKLNNDGSPRHPLYVAYKEEPKPIPV